MRYIPDKLICPIGNVPVTYSPLVVLLDERMQYTTGCFAPLHIDDYHTICRAVNRKTNHMLWKMICARVHARSNGRG